MMHFSFLSNDKKISINSFIIDIQIQKHKKDHDFKLSKSFSMEFVLCGVSFIKMRQRIYYHYID